MQRLLRHLLLLLCLLLSAYPLLWMTLASLRTDADVLEHPFAWPSSWQLRSYGGLAAELEPILGRRTSARAVGSAVGRNPISLLIPCHRVIHGDGSLGGYSSGPEIKRILLKLENDYA